MLQTNIYFFDTTFVLRNIRFYTSSCRCHRQETVQLYIHDKHIRIFLGSKGSLCRHHNSCILRLCKDLQCKFSLLIQISKNLKFIGSNCTTFGLMENFNIRFCHSKLRPQSRLIDTCSSITTINMFCWRILTLRSKTH